MVVARRNAAASRRLDLEAAMLRVGRDPQLQLRQLGGSARSIDAAAGRPAAGSPGAQIVLGEARELDHGVDDPPVELPIDDVQQALVLAGLTGALAQLVAGDAVGTASRPQPKAFGRALQQVILQRLLVLQIQLFLPLLQAVERWLGDVQVAVLDDLREVPVEEGQQQRPDVFPSTSASVMMMIRWYRSFAMSFSFSTPQPSAVISVTISCDESIFSSRAFSTFRSSAQRQDRLILRLRPA